MEPIILTVAMTMSWIPKLIKQNVPLYLAIAECMARDISVGKLLPETRLPTQRQLAESLGVAIGTITKAYSEAESHGWIYSDGRRGTFVGESKKHSAGFNNPFHPKSDLIDLSHYYPPTSEDPDLPLILKRLSTKPSTQWLLTYQSFHGENHDLMRHKIAGTKWIEKMGLKTEPKSVLISVGAQHALTVILASIAQRGNTILTGEHSYPGLKAIAELLGLNLIGIPIDNNGLDTNAIELICKKSKIFAIYCNPTFQNPTNTVLSESRRRKIGAISRKYGLWIIEDDPNRWLLPNPPSLLSSIAPERTFFIASPSKLLGGGLRISFIVCPPNVQQSTANAISSTVIQVPLLSAEILLHWIEDGTVDETIIRRRVELKIRNNMVQEILKNYTFKRDPLSYFCWLHLPQRWTAKEFADSAKNSKVLVAPADYFAVDNAAELRAIRICLGGNVSRIELRKALIVLAGILGSNEKPRFTAF